MNNLYDFLIWLQKQASSVHAITQGLTGLAERGEALERLNGKFRYESARDQRSPVNTATNCQNKLTETKGWVFL